MHDISVAVPTLNSARYLENTLFSLVRQTGCSVDIIVADSGSVDETLNICNKYSIKTIFVPPGSMYSAINKALEECESTWLCYLNSDDLIYPNSYARLIYCGERQNADIVYGGCDFVDDEGRFIHSFTPGRPKELKSHFLTSEMSFAQPTAIFRRNVFEQLGGFNEQYQHVSDFDFFFRAINAGFKFAMLEGKSVSGFRTSPTQISRKIEQVQKEIKLVHQVYAQPTIKDRWVTGLWKIRNWPNYLIRLLRYKVLTGKLKIARTSEIYGDEDHVLLK
jgi:glycosyltransferase involved in cell wall biosynthesis